MAEPEWKILNLIYYKKTAGNETLFPRCFFEKLFTYGDDTEFYVCYADRTEKSLTIRFISCVGSREVGHPFTIFTEVGWDLQRVDESVEV